jgi:proteasome lid subunit RPN8/RPN11
MIWIKRKALLFMLDAAKGAFPNEFIGLLRMRGNEIREVLVLPGSTYAETFSSITEYLVPIDKSIAGSVHSHPSRSNKPSRADLRFFSEKGRIHIIVRYPFAEGDVAVYDVDGNPLGFAVT